ncbi:MAG: hypothetical protein Q7K98_04815 [Candidatus Omnitrophota bacterium]|nr:hypothetical protein [Candidatus Omnitrophota bacterium]
MIKVASTINVTAVTPRGGDALEIKLKNRGLSSVEIREARKSFNEGIELLSRMFLNCYDLEKKPLV